MWGVFSRNSLKFLGTPRDGGSPHLEVSAIMRKPIPLGSASTVPSLYDPHLQPHPNPEAQAAEMACKRMFLITGTPSSPRPSLLPPSPFIPPCFFSSPPPFFPLVYTAHLHTLGERGEIVSSAIFHTSLKRSARLFPAEQRDNGPPGASRLSEDPQNTYPLREPSLPGLATPHGGRRSMQNKIE